MNIMKEYNFRLWRFSLHFEGQMEINKQIDRQTAPFWLKQKFYDNFTDL